MNATDTRASPTLHTNTDDRFAINNMSQQLAPDDGRTAAFVRTDDVARTMSDRLVCRHNTAEHGDVCVGESGKNGMFM